jgi:hypothetical protein
LLKARWGVNLALLILVAGMAAAMRNELATERRAGTLTGLDPNRITRVEIQRAGEPVIRLVRTAEGWQMQSPYALAANDEKVDQLVQIASTPVFRTLPQSANPERLGLAPAPIRLTLDGLTLRFGDTDPIGQRRYVAIGNQIHLIDDGFQYHLLAPATDYLSRRLLPTDFRPVAGTLDGQPLTRQTLDELGGITATGVTPAGEELSGDILSLQARETGETIRFLISADRRRWTRVDLHLRYLLAAAPTLRTAPPSPPVAGPAPPASHNQGSTP